MLEDVLDQLVCPHGEPSLRRDGDSLVCEAGHRYDVARQGYVNLLEGAAPAAADTAEMVAARARVQGAGHLDALTDALLAAVATHAPGPGTVVDLGSGPGHHLAAVLAADEGSTGIAIDLSKHAARRAARAHPRIGAVVADVWDRLPVRTGVAAVVLDVFAPRNGPEIHRVLREDGILVVVTPQPDHLAPLPEALGLLTVAADKPARLDRDLARAAVLVDRAEVHGRRTVDVEEVRDLVVMGPSAHHLEADDLDARLGDLEPRTEVALAVTVSTYRCAPDDTPIRR